CFAPRMGPVYSGGRTLVRGLTGLHQKQVPYRRGEELYFVSERKTREGLVDRKCEVIVEDAQVAPMAERQWARACASRRALLGPGDSELFHLPIQQRTLHPQPGGRPFRAAQHPVRFAEGAEDVLALRVGQSERWA